MKKIDEDFCYVGDCCVCGKPVDVDESGNCEECGGVFHWGECGSWDDWGHKCDECKNVNSR